jgi:heme/copper-type cytochrome/quinol oxidase subunit 2
MSREIWEEDDLRKRWLLLGVTCLVMAALSRAQGSDRNNAGAAKVIEISAKKYEFTPAEVRVKKGERVQLKIHSVDTTHGAKLILYPEGGKDKSTPGLKLTDPNQNEKVEKNVDQVIDFVAVQAGTYEIKCAKLCGMGHGRMKGKLIVEE